MKLSLIPEAFDCFRYGEQVENIALGKTTGNLSAVIGLFLAAAFKLAGDLGYAVHITPEQTLWLAGGLGYVLLQLVHFATSKHAGILPSKPEPIQVGAGDTPSRPAVLDASALVGSAQDVPIASSNLGQAPISGQPDLTA